MTDQTDPRPLPTDLEWARLVKTDLDEFEPTGGYTPDYDHTIPTRRMRSLCQTIIDQAAELESLRDRGDQSVPRVLDAFEEIDALPSGTVIRDKWGQVQERNGTHWYAIQNEDAFYEASDLGSPVTVIFVPEDGAL